MDIRTSTSSRWFSSRGKLVPGLGQPAVGRLLQRDPQLVKAALGCVVVLLQKRMKRDEHDRRAKGKGTAPFHRFLRWLRLVSRGVQDGFGTVCSRGHQSVPRRPTAGRSVVGFYQNGYQPGPFPSQSTG